MLLSRLGSALWATGLLGHLLLLGVLIGRRRAASFPFFAALIAASVVRTMLLFALRSKEEAYLAAYLATSFLDALLQFGVIYEVADRTFRPLGRWTSDTRRGMAVVVCISVALAVGLTWLAGPVSSDWRSMLIVKTSFLESVLFSELFLGIVMLSVTVGLPWKTHVSRIAYGLGAYSILDIAIEAGHALYGPSTSFATHQVLTFIRQIGYLACLVYWIVTLWPDPPPPRTLSDEMRKQLDRLQSGLAYDLYTIRNWRKP